MALWDVVQLPDRLLIDSLPAPAHMHVSGRWNVVVWTGQALQQQHLPAMGDERAAKASIYGMEWMDGMAGCDGRQIVCQL